MGLSYRLNVGTVSQYHWTAGGLLQWKDRSLVLAFFNDTQLSQRDTSGANDE
jgi:hypothetical protein